MLLQIVLSLVVLGVLYKFVRFHGCGLACQRYSPSSRGYRGPDMRAECTCVCATCPCSPLDSIFQPFNINPEVLETCRNKVLEWVNPEYGRSTPTTAHRHTQFPTPIVIEEARSPLSDTSEPFYEYGSPESLRPSDPNYRASEPNFRTETGGRIEPTSSSSKPFLKRNKMDNRMAEMCNKCKQKGLTCIGTCPKAKIRNVSNNTDV